MLLTAFNSFQSLNIRINEKIDYSDLVTEYDENIEAFIKGEIKAAFPEHKYFFYFTIDL